MHFAVSWLVLLFFIGKFLPLYKLLHAYVPLLCLISFYVASKLILINSRKNRDLSLPENCEIFQKKFDQLQDDLESVSVCDELLAGKCTTVIDIIFVHFTHNKPKNGLQNFCSIFRFSIRLQLKFCFAFMHILNEHYTALVGMLGKAKGQILRVAACLQMFFCDKLAEEEEYEVDMPIIQADLPTIITADAVAAAIDYVEVCCQHTLFVTGRQLLRDEVKKYTEGIVKCFFCLFIVGKIS